MLLAIANVSRNNVVVHWGPGDSRRRSHKKYVGVLGFHVADHWRHIDRLYGSHVAYDGI